MMGTRFMYPCAHKYYRDLKWWYGGWYSVRHWQYVCWLTDDYGNAVQVEKIDLALFYNLVA